MQIHRRIGQLTRGLPRHLVVIIGLAGFVVALYVVVVLGGGVIIGRTSSPSLALSVLATAAVALLFAPVQIALEGVAARLGYRAAAKPYDVLNRFSETPVSGSATEELPARMARLLGQGTGAQWAQVWLTVSDQLTLAATWPLDARADETSPRFESDALEVTDNGRRALAVLHGDQRLGLLRLQERPGMPLTTVEARLFAGLAAQAGLVLRLVGLRAELQERHQDLVARANELTASRERLIDTQDTERRRLERDIHDGAQQHLVALKVNLRLAQTIAVRSPERAAHVLSEQADAARVAIDTLSSLSRGIYPGLLATEGLVPALRLAVATSPVPVSIDTVPSLRLPAPVEAALYFCCMEAVQNAVKHSGTRNVAVRYAEDHGRCQLTIVDQGHGFDLDQVLALGSGAGLANMRDRLDAVGGTITVRSLPGRGTVITAVVSRTETPAPQPPVPLVPDPVV